MEFSAFQRAAFFWWCTAKTMSRRASSTEDLVVVPPENVPPPGATSHPDDGAAGCRAGERAHLVRQVDRLSRSAGRLARPTPVGLFVGLFNGWLAHSLRVFAHVTQPAAAAASTLMWESPSTLALRSLQGEAKKQTRDGKKAGLKEEEKGGAVEG